MSQVSQAALARLSELPEGQPIAVDASIDGETESLILFREGESVRAWRNICPHAGRRLDWSPGQFLRSKEGLLICAVHGASFKLSQGGECVAGPCKGQSLVAVDVLVHDGAILLGRR